MAKKYAPKMERQYAELVKRIQSFNSRHPDRNVIIPKATYNRYYVAIRSANKKIKAFNARGYHDMFGKRPFHVNPFNLDTNWDTFLKHHKIEDIPDAIKAMTTRAEFINKNPRKWSRLKSAADIRSGLDALRQIFPRESADINDDDIDKFIEKFNQLPRNMQEKFLAKNHDISVYFQQYDLPKLEDYTRTINMTAHALLERLEGWIESEKPTVKGSRRKKAKRSWKDLLD